MNLIKRASWILKGLVLGSIVLLSACSQQYGDGEGRSSDTSDGQKIYSAQCASCHGPNGEGGSGGALVACAACGTEESLIAKIEKDMPSASNPLSGQDSIDVAKFILLEFNGASAGAVSRTMPGVTTMTSSEAVHKIAFELAGRLPSEDEIETFRSGLAGEREVVMGFMESNYFYERLKDMFNDSLLTDGYLDENSPGNSSLGRDIDSLYANIFELNKGNGDYQAFANLNWEDGYIADNGLMISDNYLEYFSRSAIARKPLLLAEYIARNNRDFREFVSGKYTVVNRFSYEAFNNGKDLSDSDVRANVVVVDPDSSDEDGALDFASSVTWAEWNSEDDLIDYMDEVGYYISANPLNSLGVNNETQRAYVMEEFPYDPRDLKPVQVFYNDEDGNAESQGVPHSGVITDEIFLNKYTAMDTNMHRNRARMIYWFFAAKDLLAIEGNRDVEELEFEDFGNSVGVDDPTATNPDCIVCHVVMDPVAKAFENTNLAGLYDVGNLEAGTHDDSIGWGLSRSEFQTSGVNGYNTRELQWLGEQVANDAAYSKGIAQIVVRGLLGQDVLGQPGEDSPASYVGAYTKQTDLITRAAGEFANSGFNIKELIYSITKSAYYRASSLVYDGTGDEYLQVGSVRYLPPQKINQKLRALNSGGWSNSQNLYNLTDRMNMGGKNTSDVQRDVDSVSGIISALIERMAVEEACDIVRNEFNSDISDRVLFNLVDDTTNLEAVSASGRLAQMASIRSQIVKLYLGALHHEVSTDSEEVDIAFDLFMNVLRDESNSTCDTDGSNFTVNGTYSTGEVREAWYAVMVYILTDYRFIYG